MNNFKIKITSFIIIGLFLTLLFGGSLFACKITFGPKKIKIAKDGTAKVTVFVKWEHRKCVLDEDDINIDYKGIKKISTSGWKKIKRGYYKNELKIKLLKSKGSIRVWRECSKKGLSEGILKLSKSKKSLQNKK